MPDELVVLVEGVSFAYEGTALVLEDVTFSLARGSVLGLVGPNGGGKTTLVKILLRLLPLQRGHVALFNCPLGRFKDWHRIGYVSQMPWSSDRLFPVTVEEVVALGRAARRGALRRMTAEDRAHIRFALESVGLLAHRRTSLAHLSLGQQKRAFLARALASGAELLVLDEPTAAMDPGAREDFRRLVGKLSREQGLTVLEVTHDLAGAVAHFTHVACLNRRLIFFGPVEKALAPCVLLSLYGEGRAVGLAQSEAPGGAMGRETHGA